MFFKVAGYAGVMLGLIGSAFVAFDQCLYANCIWLVGNVLLAIDAYRHKNYKSILLFLGYEIVATVGVVRYLSLNGGFPL